MKDWCLAYTGAEAPWVALGFAIVLIIAGAVMLRQARLRRGLAVTAAMLAALVAMAGLSIVPAPAFAASAAGLGTACPTAAEHSVALPVAAPAVVVPPVEPTPTLVGATLGDFVWIDMNQDGIQDPIEEPAVGAQITLLDAATGQPVTAGFDGRAIASTQISDDAGRYSFTGLAAGSYLLRLETASSVVGEIVTVGNEFAGRIYVGNNRGGYAFNEDNVALPTCTGRDQFQIQLPGLGHFFATSPEPTAFYASLEVTPVVGTPTTRVNAGIGIPEDDDFDSDIDPVTRQTSDLITLVDGQTVTGVDIGLNPAIANYISLGC